MDSILVVDCGSATSKAALIEKQGEVHRFVAQAVAGSTHGAPWRDITLGVRLAIQRLEQTTERKLLYSEGTPIVPRASAGDGVDALVVVASAGQPLRVMLAGLMEDFSLRSARRAAATTYAVVPDALSLDCGAVQPGLEARILAVYRARPDVILLAGGTDGGAERPAVDLLRIVATALTVLQDFTRPKVIFAGNLEVREEAADLLGTVTDLKAVDNVHPALDVENPGAAQIELESLYLDGKLSQVPGYDALRDWSQSDAVPTARSFAQTVRYLGGFYNLNVIAADVGSAATTVAVKRADFESATTRADVGVGLSVESVMEQAGLEAIARWLPFELAGNELRNFLLNKSLHPASVPETPEEFLIELAVAREALRLVVAQSRQSWPAAPGQGAWRLAWEMIIGGGRVITRVPHPAYAALALLDGLEPVGVSTLSLDRNGLVGMLGAVAAVHPAAAVEVAEHDALFRLGTVVAVAGNGRIGETALRGKITFEDGRSESIKVPFGSLSLIPLGLNEKATLKLKPRPRFDIGMGRWGEGAIAEVEGGSLGLVLDARGRPLRLQTDPAARCEQVREWMNALGLAWETLQLIGRAIANLEQDVTVEAANVLADATPQ